jgi:hypothetical protein
MNWASIIPLFVCFGAIGLAEDATYQPLTGQERWRLYRTEMLRPGVVFAAAGPALGGQLNNEPAVWGQGMAGYSRRLADQWGRQALRQTYQAGAAAALGQDVRYFPSGKTGFFPRAGHAFAAGFITIDRHGHKTPNVSFMAAAIGAEFTARAWRPDGYNSASRAMRGAGFQIGVNSAFNLVREFKPELKRTLGFRR